MICKYEAKPPEMQSVGIHAEITKRKDGLSRPFFTTLCKQNLHARRSLQGVVHVVFDWVYSLAETRDFLHL